MWRIWRIIVPCLSWLAQHTYRWSRHKPSTTFCETSSQDPSTLLHPRYSKEGEIRKLMCNWNSGNSIITPSSKLISNSHYSLERQRAWNVQVRKPEPQPGKPTYRRNRSLKPKLQAQLNLVPRTFPYVVGREKPWERGWAQLCLQNCVFLQQQNG